MPLYWLIMGVAGSLGSCSLLKNRRALGNNQHMRKQTGSQAVMVFTILVMYGVAKRLSRSHDQPCSLLFVFTSFFRWSDLLQILRWFIVCSPLQFFSFFVWCSIFWVYEKRVSALHQKPYELWPHNSKRSSNHLKSDNGKNWKRRARKER